MEFLKKKKVLIPLGIILLLAMFGAAPKLAGVLIMLASLAGGGYLYTRNEKFKSYNKGIKALITAGLVFAFLVGIGGVNYDPKVAEQQRLAAEKATVEQQQKDEATKKTEEAKKQEEAKKAEESKNQAEEQQKSSMIAKLNLKEATVSRVVDGDTVELSDGSKVRFIGVNTPESTTTTEQYGKEASDYTKGKLTGKVVYLEKDVSETDKYGRLLRYVWLDVPKEITDTEIKAKMFNAVLVEEGYAEQSTYAPDVKYAEYFKNYAAEARTASKGLWAINPNGTTKGDTDKASVSNNSASSSSSSSGSSSSSSSSSSNGGSSSSGYIPGGNSTSQSTGEFVITMTGKKYHRPSCRTIKQVKATVTREEAESMGYGPCGVCHP